MFNLEALSRCVCLTSFITPFNIFICIQFADSYESPVMSSKVAKNNSTGISKVNYKCALAIKFDHFYWMHQMENESTIKLSFKLEKLYDLWHDQFWKWKSGLSFLFQPCEIMETHVKPSTVYHFIYYIQIIYGKIFREYGFLFTSSFF